MSRLFLITVLLASVAVARAATPVTSLPAELVQQQVLDLVNQARTRGRTCGTRQFPPTQPLVASDLLHRAARAHARDMARRSYFEHQGRDGSAPADRVRRAGYRFRFTGENIAFGPETAAEVVNGWLGSPGHCANMMDPRFLDMGVAVALGNKRGHYYWVQELGLPMP